MSRMQFPRRLAAVLAAALLLTGAIAGGAPRAPATEREIVPADLTCPGVLIGGNAGAAKAQVDTICLIGGPGQLSGKFEQANHTTPDPQGWYGVDLTQHAAARWQVSAFLAANLDPPRPGNNAMWCGQTFAAACDAGDVPEGYDNDYDEWLDWRGTVSDNTVATIVNVTAILNSDTEPGYDYLQLEFESATGMTRVGTAFTGIYTGAVFNRTFSVAAADYVGAGHDEIHLRWRATSDAAWSDGDCFWPTAGHSQLDNVGVSFDGALQTFDDFEAGSPVHWFAASPPGVGNFAKVWPRLSDLDLCTENMTPQWAFIDDGVVVPGTGGTLGTTWTYGPGGYVVNLLGGLAGPGYSLDNQIWSPPIDWPAGCEGGRLAWNVYGHLPLSNGLFAVWYVRSSTDSGATWSPWQSDNLIYWAGNSPAYYRSAYDLRTYLIPGCNRVQVALGALEQSFGTYYETDGTPSPYFDNVALSAWPIGGPAITAREIDLFNDGWPASAAIDYADLSRNSVRLDMARNISPRLHLRNDPGDSIIMTIAPIRAGSVLDGRPELFVRMKANPLFDGVRALPAGFSRTGHVISGTVPGDTVRVNNIIQANRWSWDLPDTGFCFPGDALHYFIRARDNLAGDIGTTYLPADTTGFSQFPGDPGYGTQTLSEVFRTDALPTLFSATPGGQPHVLFWNDARDRSNQNEWFGALDNLGWRLGVDYDMYCTNGPSSGVGNGLGGRTNAAKLAGYNTLLYCAANLTNYTLSNGDFTGDPGNDIAVVDAWLSLGGRNMFATGDNIIQDLSYSGVAFRDKWFSVAYNAADVRPLIGGQTAPVVSPLAVAGAPVISGPYVAFGGCDGGLNDFDAVTAAGAAVSIAEFTSPAGVTGAYPYAAAIYNNVVASAARVVFMPYDLCYIYGLGAKAGTRPIRADILQELLTFFGEAPGGLPVGVPQPAVFSVRGSPNPFNPAVRIAYDLPARGPLSLKLYDVRGRLVRVLLDGVAEAGPGAATWDGRDGAGSATASGVYFCEARGGGQVIVETLTLVR